MKTALFLLVLLALPLSLAASLEDAQYIVVVRDDGTPQDVIFAANFAAAMRSSQDFGGYTAGVTFASATDKQLAESLTMDDLRDKLVIVLDVPERTAIAIVGESAPTQAIIVLGAAGQYLTQDGFTVIGFVTDQPWHGNAAIWHDETQRQIVANVLTETYVYDGDEVPFSYDGPVFEDGHVIAMADIYAAETPVEDGAQDDQDASGDASDDGGAAGDDAQVPIDGGDDAVVDTPEDVVVTGTPAIGAGAENPQQEPEVAPIDEQGFFVRIWNWFAGLFG